MGRAILDQKFNDLVAASGNAVAGSGFVRQRFVLRMLSEGNAGVIEFQKSSKSSAGAILLTVNVGVICGALLEPWQPVVEKAKSSDAHLRLRIGAMLPGRLDKWWEITNATDGQTLQTEIANLIASEAAPYVKRYISTNELVALWKSGQSPGLTEMQRIHYLERLVQNA